MFPKKHKKNNNHKRICMYKHNNNDDNRLLEMRGFVFVLFITKGKTISEYSRDLQEFV